MKRFICVFSCLVLICSGCGADHMAMALRSYNRNHNSQENIHLVYHQLDCALERSENNSQKALIFYIYGLLREEQEDIAAAESYYRRSLHFSPRFLDPIVKLADCCFRKKEYAEALQLYREAFFIVNDDMKDFEDGKPNPSHILSDPYIKYAVENNLVPSVYYMGKYPKKNALHGESTRKMSKQIKILIENKIKAAEQMIPLHKRQEGDSGNAKGGTEHLFML